MKSIKKTKKTKIVTKKSALKKLKVEKKADKETFKNDDKHQHFKLTEAVKNSINISAVLKKILKSFVRELTVHNLLEMSLKLHKFFFSFLFDDIRFSNNVEIIQVWVFSYHVIDAALLQSVFVDVKNILYVTEIL